MKYSRDVFVHQMPLIDSFVKHLILHRAVRPHVERLKPDPFWQLTSDAHINQAIIAWCTVFGSNDTNDTHWHHLNPADGEALRRSFREHVLPRAGLSFDEWTNYQKDMRDYRNKQTAHIEIGVRLVTPVLDHALAVCFAYDTWIREVIAPDILATPPLEECAEELRRIVVSYVDSLA